MTRNTRIFLAWFFTALLFLTGGWLAHLAGDLPEDVETKNTAAFSTGFYIGWALTPFLFGAVIQVVWQAISKKARAAKRFHTRLNWTTFVFVLIMSLGVFGNSAPV